MTAPTPENPAAPDWHPRLLEILANCARERRCISYAELAAEAAIPGPKTIHKLTDMLERLVSLDYAEGRPLRAAVAVSKSGARLPAPGFFQHCAALGLYFGPDRGPQAELFHRLELDRLFVNGGSDPEDL